MKKILTAAVSMFVLCGLMVSCSEDDKNKIIRNEQNGNTVNTTVPNDTMAQDEKDTINNAETLSLVDYEIYELRFGSYYFSDGSQEFTLGSNAKYSFVFGLRDNKTGHIAYYTIQNSTWTFSSDNAAITKYADTGFNASSSFYSNANAEITVDISYKGLNKSFKFTLKSTVKNPNENPQSLIFEGVWDRPGGNYRMVFQGNNFYQYDLAVDRVPDNLYYKTTEATWEYNSSNNTLTLSLLQGGKILEDVVYNYGAGIQVKVKKWVSSNETLSVNATIIANNQIVLGAGSENPVTITKNNNPKFNKISPLEGTWKCPSWNANEYFTFSDDTFTSYEYDSHNETYWDGSGSFVYFGDTATLWYSGNHSGNAGHPVGFKKITDTQYTMVWIDGSSLTFEKQ